MRSSTPGLLGSLDALLVPVLPLPSPLGLLLLAGPLLGPLAQVARELIPSREDVDGVLPSGLEAREEGPVSDFIAVLGPVVVVLFYPRAISVEGLKLSVRVREVMAYSALRLGTC